MISLKIVDVKAFMSSLLVHNVFDNFLLTEMEINTMVRFQVDGDLNQNFFSTDEKEVLGDRSYATWSEIKPFAYQVVKGNKTPSSFKMVFLLSKSNLENVIKKNELTFRLEDIGGLFLNIRYDHNGLYIITGTSMKIFTLDKTMDHIWDRDVKKFLKYHEIAFEEE